jgi:hypothetical protein
MHREAAAAPVRHRAAGRERLFFVEKRSRFRFCILAPFNLMA